MPIPCRGSPAVLFLICLFSVQTVSAGDYHYRYFKDRVPLSEARGWIAVKNLSGSRDALGDLVRELYDVAEEYDIGPPGWSVCRLAYAPLAEQTIPELVERDVDGDYYFAPVFRGGGEVRGVTDTIPGKTILVQWAEAHDAGLAAALLPDGCTGGNVIEPAPFGGLPGAYRIDPGCHSGLDVLSFANDLAMQPEVVFAEPDMLVGGAQKVTPSDDRYPDSWGLNNEGQTGGVEDIDINAPESWDITTGIQDVVTVVLDDGVSQNHPDLGQVTPGRDFTGQSGSGGPVNRCDNHGTAVAGVITSLIDGNGTVGVAPDARSRSARVFISEVPASSSTECSGRWTTQFSWTVDALDWAQSQGARVTNNSNSYDSRSSSVASKYQQTRDAGMLHFASAGNDAIENVSFPADLASVNGVSAVDHSGNLASFSNYGARLSLSGPGVGIQVTDRPGSPGYESGDYTELDGTSFAAPMAAGAGVLMLSRASNMTGGEVELFLQASARDLGPPGFDIFFGWGMVDARTALVLLDIFSDGLESGDTSKWAKTVP